MSHCCFTPKLLKCMGHSQESCIIKKPIDNGHKKENRDTQLVPLALLELNQSFELHCHYSEAICCCTGKFVCKIYSTPNDLNYGKAILKGSMSETTYCCSSRVKPYHTNKLKLKTSKKIPAFLVQIETPDFEATTIEIRSSITKDTIGTITLLGVHKYEITVFHEKGKIIAEGTGSWLTGLWDYTFRTDKGTKIAYLESTFGSCHLEFFGSINTAIKACLIAFMLKTEIFRLAGERSANYELLPVRQPMRSLCYFIKNNAFYNYFNKPKPYKRFVHS